MEVVQLHQVDDAVLADVQELVRQLSTSAEVLARDALEQIVEAECTTIFVARDAGRIIGMLTLVVFTIPTGVRAWIEDVVVDDSARDQGVGSALTRWALEYAKTCGARTVDLTSRPSREAANAMYEKLGFERRETNVYRFELDEERRG